MANRRDLKRNINGLLGDVIEECYNALLNDDSLDEAKVEAIVDEAADLANDLVARTNAAKKLASSAERKKHFSDIKEELSDKVIGFIEQLNAL